MVENNFDIAASAPTRAHAVETPFRRLVADFSESRLAMIGLVSLTLLCLIAVFAPVISPQDPYDQAQLNLLDAELAPGSIGMDGTLYVLGTDGQGRDMLSAIFYGLRISLGIGLVSGLVAFSLGLVIGISAAYFGGRFDTLVMRIVDIQLGFPAILIALVLLAVVGRGVDKVIIALVASPVGLLCPGRARGGHCQLQDGVHCRGQMPGPVHAKGAVPAPAAQLPAAPHRGLQPYRWATPSPWRQRCPFWAWVFR